MYSTELVLLKQEHVEFTCQAVLKYKPTSTHTYTWYMQIYQVFGANLVIPTPSLWQVILQTKSTDGQTNGWTDGWTSQGVTMAIISQTKFSNVISWMKFLYFGLNITEVYPIDNVNSGSCNGLALNGWQAITWTDIDPDHCHHMVSQAHNDFSLFSDKSLPQSMSAKIIIIWCHKPIMI